MSKPMPRKKIGLITPYTGDNLGDAAIQSAVIENLRARLPGFDLCMFTLDPPKTSALHQVPSLPITGVFIDFYSNQLRPAPANGNGNGHGNGNGDSAANAAAVASRAAVVRKLVRALRNDRALRALFQPAWCVAKGVFTSVVMPGTEVRHVREMYRLLKEFELVIVSGGGQVDDYWGGVMGQPYTLLKWGLLAKAAKSKFIFLSVGVDKIDNRLSRAVVGCALRLARYRSYRDRGSKQLLADMKFTHADRVVPDLAFSYPIDGAEPVVEREGAEGPLRVGISPIAYLRKGHWPRTNGGTFERYCETLQAFTTELLRRGHEVVFFATDAPDREVSELVAARVKAAYGRSDGRLKLRIAPVSRVHELLAEVKALDCVVASRLHGVILSHLCLRPVLAISYDRKVTRHMNDLEQADYCLDFHTLEVAQLIKTFESLSLRRDAATAILKRKTHSYRTELESQYDDLVRRVYL